MEPDKIFNKGTTIRIKKRTPPSILPLLPLDTKTSMKMARRRVRVKTLQLKKILPVKEKKLPEIKALAYTGFWGTWLRED